MYDCVSTYQVGVMKDYEYRVTTLIHRVVSQEPTKGVTALQSEEMWKDGTAGPQLQSRSAYYGEAYGQRFFDGSHQE